jgi:hypothetical protein
MFGSFFPTEELFQLAGNGMAIRCVMLAVAVALRSVNPHHVRGYIVD